MGVNVDRIAPGRAGAGGSSGGGCGFNVELIVATANGEDGPDGDRSGYVIPGSDGYRAVTVLTNQDMLGKDGPKPVQLRLDKANIVGGKPGDRRGGIVALLQFDRIGCEGDIDFYLVQSTPNGQGGDLYQSGGYDGEGFYFGDVYTLASERSAVGVPFWATDYPEDVALGVHTVDVSAKCDDCYASTVFTIEVFDSRGYGYGYGASGLGADVLYDLAKK